MSPKAITQKVPHRSPDLVNWIVIGVILIAVLYTTYATWAALQLPISSSIPVSVASPKARPSVTPDATLLNLNNPHQHLGPLVQVDLGNIGRDNPFAKP
jgi:hypothetical protein